MVGSGSFIIYILLHTQQSDTEMSISNCKIFLKMFFIYWAKSASTAVSFLFACNDPIDFKVSLSK